MIASSLPSALICCCNGGSSESHLTYISPDPRLDEGRSFGQPLRLPTSSDGHLFLKQSPNNGPSGPPVSARGHGSFMPGSSTLGTSRNGLSSEEKQKEKERLQDMVKEFAKTAVQGQHCHWLPPAENSRTSQPASRAAPRQAQYVLDTALRTFIVRCQDGTVMPIAMERITDIVKNIWDTPFTGLTGLPPPHLLSGDELDKRFVCVCYQADAGADGALHLALLMPNQHERERFYTCMKILRWALDTKKGKT